MNDFCACVRVHMCAIMSVLHEDGAEMKGYRMCESEFEEFLLRKVRKHLIVLKTHRRVIFIDSRDG